ncbi:hypothetical protein K438DRAFT_1857177 [Mycena galopus ATCC 62051]|nr:hypothetical protein K438DRAFT_1857177 [Mycena galopus ATCC 62051]
MFQSPERTRTHPPLCSSSDLSMRARHSACVSTPLASFFSFQIVPPTRARGERRGIERDMAPFSESATRQSSAPDVPTHQSTHAAPSPPHPDLRNLGMRPHLHPHALVSPLTMTASGRHRGIASHLHPSSRLPCQLDSPTLYKSFIPLPHCFDSSGRSCTAKRDDIPSAIKPVSVNWAEKRKKD